MIDAEILGLAYQKQAAGDARSLAEIVVEIRSDAASLTPVFTAADIIGGGVLRLPDGTEESIQIMGDGSRQVMPGGQ